MNALHTCICLHWVPSAVRGVFALSLLGVAEGEVCTHYVFIDTILYGNALSFWY